MTPWKHTLADWTKLDIPSAQLILAQAEDKLKNNAENLNIADRKTDRMLQITIPSLLTLAGYIGNYLINYWHKPSFGVAIAIVCIPFLGTALWFLIKNLFPTDQFCWTGTEPQTVLVSALFENDLDEREKHLALLYNLITGKQFSIDFNNKIISEKIKYNKIILKSLCFSASSIPLGCVVYHLWAFLL